MANAQQIEIWQSKEKLKAFYHSVSEDKKAFLTALAYDKRYINTKNYKENTPVMELLDWGLAEEKDVRFAVENGLNLESVGFMGDTILGLVVRKMNYPMAAYLLEKGANPNVHNIYGGRTPLIMAAEMGEVDLIRLLLKYNANPLLETPKGETPRLVSERVRQEIFSDQKRASLAQSTEFISKWGLSGFDRNRDNMFLVESLLKEAERQRI